MFENLDDPRQQALLAAAFGLLGGQGGKGFGGFARDAGRAGLLGMNAYNQASVMGDRRKEEEQQRKLREMQMGEMQRGIDFNKALSAGFSPGAPAQQTFAPNDYETPSQFTPAKPAGFDFTQAMKIDPVRGWQAQQMMAKPAVAPIKVGRDDRLIDPVTNKTLVDAQAPYWQNPEWVKTQMAIRAAGRPQVTTNVTTDKTYAGNVASGLAAQDVAAIDAAKSAPDRLATARQVKDLLARNPITGTGAEARLGLEKALATAGVVGNERVADTETLVSLLASQTLDAIKTSGLGSGQGFTDKDRQFLEKARAGNIEINAATLRSLALLNERSAVLSINRGNKIIERLRKDPGMGNVGLSLDSIQLPQEPKAAQGALTPSEQAELEMLRQKFRKGR